MGKMIPVATSIRIIFLNIFIHMYIHRQTSMYLKGLDIKRIMNYS